jgi:hypothetical protein
MPNITILNRFSSELAANKLLVVSAPVNAELVIRELVLVVNLNSIPEVPNYVEDNYLTDDQKNALFWKQSLNSKSKKVVTWIGKNNDTTRLIDFFIFNRQPYYVENMLTRYTGLSTLTLEAETKLYLSIENTNSGLLGSGDWLTVWGQAQLD